jgi:hypothetical protein
MAHLVQQGHQSGVEACAPINLSEHVLDSSKSLGSSQLHLHLQSTHPPFFELVPRRNGVSRLRGAWLSAGLSMPPSHNTRGLWLGWAYLAKKVPHAATMPIVTAVVCFLSTQNMGS